MWNRILVPRWLGRFTCSHCKLESIASRSVRDSCRSSPTMIRGYLQWRLLRIERPCGAARPTTSLEEFGRDWKLTFTNVGSWGLPTLEADVYQRWKLTFTNVGSWRLPTLEADVYQRWKLTFTNVGSWRLPTLEAEVCQPWKLTFTNVGSWGLPTNN
jgi:hypothetical protein